MFVTKRGRTLHTQTAKDSKGLSTRERRGRGRKGLLQPYPAQLSRSPGAARQPPKESTCISRVSQDKEHWRGEEGRRRTPGVQLRPRGPDDTGLTAPPCPQERRAPKTPFTVRPENQRGETKYFSDLYLSTFKIPANSTLRF